MQTWEEAISDAVLGGILGRGNELLNDSADDTRLLEAGDVDVRAGDGEMTETERVVKLAAYQVTVTMHGGEHDCYVYAAMVQKILDEAPALGGLVERAALVRKVYNKPRVSGCGDWEAVLTIRVTVEGEP